MSSHYFTGGSIGISQYQIQGEKMRKKWRRSYSIRYFAVSDAAFVEAKILNKAVAFAQDGNYQESIALHKQVEGALLPEALNNLAVLNEINGDQEQARNYYLEALSYQPGNKFFRKNFNRVK